MAIETVTIPGVELLKAGRWFGGGCPTDGCEFTADKLDDVIEAYNATRDTFHMPVKIGHGSQTILEGAPAAGWIENLRRQGDVLIGDLVRVPQRLAEMIVSGAYRKRSVELYEGYKVGGKRWPLVLTALALLGAELPACEGLADIEQWYSRGGLNLSLAEGGHVVVFEASGLERIRHDTQTYADFVKNFGAVEADRLIRVSQPTDDAMSTWDYLAANRRA